MSVLMDLVPAQFFSCSILIPFHYILGKLYGVDTLIFPKIATRSNLTFLDTELKGMFKMKIILTVLTQPNVVTEMRPRRSKSVEMSHTVIVCNLEHIILCRSF